MSAFDSDIRRFRSRILLTTALRYAVMGLTGWIFAWGAGAIVLRAIGWAAPAQLMWGLLGCAGALALAVHLARRNAPPDEQVLAAMDRSSEAGGLLMADGETDIGAWQVDVPQPAQLRCRWQGRNWWVALAAAGAFVAVALLLPDSLLTVAPRHVLDVDKEVKRLTAQIETLKKEDLIAPDQAETLQEKLDRLRAEASGDDPVKTWESLDHVEKTVRTTAAEAAEELAAQKDKLDTARTLAEALAKAQADKAKAGEKGTDGPNARDGQNEPDEKLLAEAMKELADMARDAAAENQAVADEMEKSLSEACKDGELSKEQLDELAEALREGGRSGEGRQLSEEQLRELSEALGEAGEGLSETLKELAEAGMIDSLPEEMAPGEGEEMDLDDLIDFIEANQGEGSIAELAEIWRRQGPGRGGIDRGRGDADMTWSDGTKVDGTKSKPQALPPAAVAALKKSRLSGVSLGSPSKAGDKTTDTGVGALSGATAGGGSAHTHVILPRHRGAVGRYFDRPKAGAGEKN